jgi:hypothetical protein
MKSDLNPSSSIDFGERLHRKAIEIEKKKENIRKSLEVEYSFTPKIGGGTPKWISSKGKQQKIANEEVAVVSGSSVLQFTSYSPNVKATLESKAFCHISSASSSKKIQKVVPSRKVVRQFEKGAGVTGDNSKENLETINL